MLRVLFAMGAVLLAFVRLIGRGLAALGRAIVRLARRSRVAVVAMIVVAAMAVVALVDTGVNWGKIYPGVSIGGVDLSGMTVDEAQSAILSRYGSALTSSDVVVYASDEARDTVDVEEYLFQQDILAEQMSIQEARENKQLWLVDANGLEAVLPAHDLAEEALAVGRENGGAIARFNAAIGGVELPVTLNYGKGLDTLIDDIDAAIGSPRKDYGVDITEGVATVTDGYDGDLVDRRQFTDEMTTALLSTDAAGRQFVAHADYAPVRIDRDQAQMTCDIINRAIAEGASFTYDGYAWGATAAELGTWVGTRLEETGDDAYRLQPFIDEEIAKPALLSDLHQTSAGADVRVSMAVEQGVVMVTPHDDVVVPLTAQALDTLNSDLFGGEEGAGENSSATEGGQPYITVESGTVSGPLPFDEALNYGIISKISSYTTEYINSDSTQNRLHNIQLAADLLNDSIVKADGGIWSFNEVVGECNADKGFLGAGAIIDNEYDDAVGGGICQVATTVFNAVYTAGLKIDERHNHTLYISSYPAGRDAAIAYPDMDLVWENNTASDIVVKSGYTDTSLTITLYGVDPHYEVESIDGEWGAGRTHTTRYEVDDTLSSGTRYVKTMGSDGSTYWVQRIVRDKDGNLVSDDTFYSEYTPIDEVIVLGPNTPAEPADSPSGSNTDANGTSSSGGESTNDASTDDDDAHGTSSDGGADANDSPSYENGDISGGSGG